MGKRERLLFFIFLVICIAWGGYTAVQSLPKWSGASDQVMQERIAVSDPSITYILKKSEPNWLEFKLPAATDFIRIVSNASLLLSLPTEPDDTWQYAFRYQLVGKNGEVLLENIYHKRTGVKKIAGKYSGETFSPVFFLSDQLTPANGQVMLLNLVQGADKLRISLDRTDSAIQDVVIRASYYEKTQRYKLDSLWKRMSDKRKAVLAEGNIYSFNMLTPQERKNILLALQRPLSPTGVEGYSYDSRILYTIKEYDEAQVYEPIASKGIIVDAHFRGVIPIPEQGGSVLLKFSPTWGDLVETTQQPIQVKWYGKQVNERTQYELDWNGQSMQYEQHFDGGLIEITSNANISVRAYLLDANEAEEITPENRYIRGYLAQENLFVEYPVVHSGKDSAPFRLDFRYIISSALTAQSSVATPPVISYALLDNQEKIVKQGDIAISAPASHYDRVVGDHSETILSDPITYYFSLPENVVKIRVNANSPVFIFAYNRPSNLIYETKVPESANVTDLENWQQPAWFPVRPASYKDSILQNQSILLTIQHRPPEDKPDLLAGRYLWEDFRPQGVWFARHLFVPIEDVGLVRKEAYSSVYRPISSGKEERIDFQAPSGNEIIRPNLAYFRQDEAPFEIKVFVDGQLHFSYWADGQKGDIRLPVISAGPHQVVVESSSPAVVFLSHTKPIQGSLLRRLVKRLDQDGLSFIYDRKSTQAETLSARLYVPDGTITRTKIRVHIENIQPLPLSPMKGWSFGLRRFDIRPDTSLPSPILGEDYEHVSRGQPFYISLGEELPPGRYQLDFDIESGVGGYLSFSKVTPGIFQQREIFQEKDLSHVQLVQ